MAVLGISAYYHDSAAALVVDGRIVAAAQEERFTRKKHDHSFPHQAIQYCLEQANLKPGDLQAVGFYDKPLLKFDRLLETYLAYAPRGFRSFLMAMPLWLRTKLHLPREMRQGLQGQYRKRFVFTDHHQSHAASAFFPSPFDEAAILTVDGVGEWATASFGSGRGNRIELTDQLNFPHSLGLLYSAFTYFCGFRVNSGEYKLMGLAPYGQPRYAQLIRTELVDIKPDGSFRMNMPYFNYCQGLTMTNQRFAQLFGGPPRSSQSPITQREMDLAASVQVVTEEILLKMARHVHHATGLKNLCLAGGVALNCVANGQLLREGPFERLWIQPAAGDAGGALGVALFIWYQLMDHSRRAEANDTQQGSRLGPAFSDDQVLAYLQQTDAVYELLPRDGQLCQRVAQLLADGHVVGWVQGRMEFGPRALGGRSILGDARRVRMQALMNLKIKFRESFRPFAPVVLQEHVHQWFELPEQFASPYMLLVAQCLEGDQSDSDMSVSGPVEEMSESSGGEPSSRETNPILQRLGAIGGPIPAVTHVDRSARVQTADPERDRLLHQLLTAFYRHTGCPVLINTSFNIRGEPIVCTPAHAHRCFLATNMDVLVLGHYLLLKHQQPHAPQHQVDQYLASFDLD